MYSDFFGLRHPPFEDRADARFYLPTSACDTILSAIEKETPQDHGITLILGETGSGKTILTRALVQRFHTSDHAVVFTAPEHGAIDLPREVCKGYGLSLPSSEGRTRCLARLRRHLKRIAEARHRAIVILDQAENLSAESLEDLELLAGLQGDHDDLMTFILVGQAPLRTLLDEPSAASLRGRIKAEHTLGRFTPRQTHLYVEHRLRTAGAGETTLFDEDAVALIHEAARGIPRLISQLCHAAMLAAYGAGEIRITRAIATSVTQRTARERSIDVRELGLRSSAASTTGLPDTRRSRLSEQVQHDPTRPRRRAAPNVTRADTGYGVGTDTYALDHEPGEFTQIKGASGHDQLGPLLEALITQGEGLLDRLENALARAESVTSTSDAFLDRHAAIEKRLAALTVGTEHACERADQVESRLSSFAEELADHTDRVQESVSQLMVGIGAGEDMRGKLEATLQEVARTTAEAQQAVAAQQTELNRNVEEAQSRTNADEERIRQLRLDLKEQLASVEGGCAEGAKAAEDKVEGLLEKVSSVLGNAEAKIDALCVRTEEEVVSRVRRQVDAADNAADKIEGLLQKLSSATEDAHERIRAALEKESLMKVEAEKAFNSQRVGHLEMMKEAEESCEKFADAALKAFRKKLDEQTEEVDRSRRNEIEDAQNELKTVTERASVASSETDAAIERLSQRVREQLEETRQQHDRIAEAALGDFRRNMKEQVEAQERVQEETTKTLNDATERHRQSVREMIDETASRLEAAENTITAGQERLEQSLATQMKSQEERVAQLKNTANEVVAQCEQSKEKLTERIRDEVDQTASRVEAAENTIAAGQERLEQSLATHMKSQEERVAQLKDTANEVVAECELSQEKLTERIRDEVDQTASRIEAAENTIAAGQERLEQSLTTCLKSQEERVTQLKNTADEVVAQCEQSKVKLTESLRAEVDDTLSAFQGSCAELLDRARGEYREFRGHLKTLETRRTDVESSLGGMAEDVQHAAAEVNGLQDATQQLGATVEVQSRKANAATADLSSVVGQAEKMLLDVEAGRGRIETLQHGVANSLVDMGAACEKVSQAQEQARYCEQVIARLTAADQEGEKVEKRLRQVVEQAGPIEEAMQRTTLDAESKIGQLDSHAAAASHVLRQLGDTNVTGHRLVEELSASNEAAAEAKEQVDRAAQDSRSTMETAEATAAELANGNAHAAALVQNLSQATSPAVEVTRELDLRSDDAREQLHRLQTGSQEAGKLVEGLNTLGRMVAAAREVDATVRRSVDEAQAMRDELTTVNDDTRQQSVTMRDLNETAGDLINEQERLTADSRASSEQLADQLSSADHTAKAGQRLLNEFAQQAQTVRKELEDQRVQSNVIKEAVARMSARPAEIVASARAQAAQLEQVCAAVQKIFAGLSQASLEARKSIKQFEGTKEEAAGRLNQLMEQTQRSSTTLHEWVEEATRVQSRLERTLKDCPPVWETHPGKTLQGVSVSTPPLSRVVNRSATGQADIPEPSRAANTLQPGEASKPVEAPREQVVARPSARADEITQMIDEAKRATAGVTS